jgi:hypothetical protein
MGAKSASRTLAGSWIMPQTQPDASFRKAVIQPCGSVALQAFWLRALKVSVTVETSCLFGAEPRSMKGLAIWQQTKPGGTHGEPPGLSGIVQVLLCRRDQYHFVFRLVLRQLSLPRVDLDLAARQAILVPHFG